MEVTSLSKKSLDRDHELYSICSYRIINFTIVTYCNSRIIYSPWEFTNYIELSMGVYNNNVDKMFIRVRLSLMYWTGLIFLTIHLFDLKTPQTWGVMIRQYGTHIYLGTIYKRPTCLLMLQLYIHPTSVCHIRSIYYFPFFRPITDWVC